MSHWNGKTHGRGILSYPLVLSYSTLPPYSPSSTVPTLYSTVSYSSAGQLVPKWGQGTRNQGANYPEMRQYLHSRIPPLHSLDPQDQNKLRYTRYYYICHNCVLNQKFTLKHVGTSDNMAGVFTKALDVVKRGKFCWQYASSTCICIS